MLLSIFCFHQLSVKSISFSSAAAAANPVSHHCDGNTLHGSLSQLPISARIFSKSHSTRSKEVHLHLMQCLFSLCSHPVTLLVPFLTFFFCLAETPLPSPRESDKLQSLKPRQYWSSTTSYPAASRSHLVSLSCKFFKGEIICLFSANRNLFSTGLLAWKRKTPLVRAWELVTPLWDIKVVWTYCSQPSTDLAGNGCSQSHWPSSNRSSLCRSSAHNKSAPSLLCRAASSPRHSFLILLLFWALNSSKGCTTSQDRRDTKEQGQRRPSKRTSLHYHQ